ncbi:hypothetical protein [Ectopseudomonas khazarica]|uniref:hypothetical protein n=1 Tax=Ectopseudomonas khazarica TaxID=2502979 RepID=UPI003A939263
MGAFSRSGVKRRSGSATGAHSLGTTLGDTIGTDAISAIFSDTETLESTFGPAFYNAVDAYALGTALGDTIDANAVSTIFGDTDALESTLGTAFCNAVGAYALGTALGDTIGTHAVSAVCSDDRGSDGLNGNLRRGESAGGKCGDNEAGEDLLFHDQAPG